MQSLPPERGWASTSRLVDPKVTIKQRIKDLINRCGYDVTAHDPNRIGHNPLSDMARFLDTVHPVVFDVGAHVGQSIQRFRSRFPGSTIHSFEPSPSTFATLQANASGLRDAHLWTCALGSASRQMTLLENRHSEMSSFLPLGPHGWDRITQETAVEVQTIDAFCRRAEHSAHRCAQV